jgi:hypothetical protein
MHKDSCLSLFSGLLRNPVQAQRRLDSRFRMVMFPKQYALSFLFTSTLHATQARDVLVASEPDAGLFMHLDARSHRAECTVFAQCLAVSPHYPAVALVCALDTCRPRLCIITSRQRHRVCMGTLEVRDVMGSVFLHFRQVHEVQVDTNSPSNKEVDRELCCANS